MYFIFSFLLFFSCHAKTKPNFIFFQPDEMRAESLGCYGHKQSQTPNFDKFAAQGTRFHEAHVSYTVCSQSRTAFMTGWPTHVRGMRTLTALLHSFHPNLLKYMKDDGYDVMWWGKNDLLAKDAWNTSVTSAMTYGGGGNGDKLTTNITDPVYYSFLVQAAKSQVTGDWKNTQAAIDYIKKWKKGDKPFFIFLPLLDPHPDYSAPEPFYSAIDPSSLPDLRPHGTNKPDYHALIRQYRNLPTNSTFLKKLNAVYLGSISWIDHIFGELLDALDETGRTNDTSVFVFADHGDYAGDYGLVEKWPSGLEDVLTRVPLMVRHPGGKPGVVIENMVQVYDIVPTVLKMAGIQETHVHFAQDLSDMVMGKSEGDPSRAAFAEGGYSSHEPRDLEGSTGIGKKGDRYYPKLKQQQEAPMSVCRAAMIKTREYKLVYRTDQKDNDHYSEFYDLSKDSREINNLYTNSTDNPYWRQISDLKSRLFLWYMQTSDVTRWVRDDRNGQPDHPQVFYSDERGLPHDIYADITPKDGFFVWK